MKKGQTNQEAAFNRSDLLIVILTIILLGAMACPILLRARVAAHEKACISNLRFFDGAKQQWALENRKGNEAVPIASDLLPYLQGRGGTHPYCEADGWGMPFCPDDPLKKFTNSYWPNSITNHAICKILPRLHIIPVNPPQIYVQPTNTPTDKFKKLGQNTIW